jgi:glycosyltransferase involved in cell wall biosynthesis
MKKLLSIVLPTYNRINDLKKSLPNLLKNIDDRCLIIISDNHSNDGTWQYLKKQKNKNIKIFRQKKNIGIAKNYYFVLSKVKTKYAMLSSDDDLVFGNYIKHCLKNLESFKNVSLIFNYKKKINKTDDYFLNTESNIAKNFNLMATTVGMCFQIDKNVLKNFPTNNKNIYPQLKLFLYLSTLGNFIICNKSGFKAIKKKPVTNLYWDYLDRPKNYGLNERIIYAKNKNFNTVNFIIILRGLAHWGYFVMSQFPKNKTNEYINSYIVIFSKYLILYPLFLVFSHFNKKRFLIIMKNYLIIRNYKFYLVDIILFLKENIYKCILYLKNLISKIKK